MAAPLGCSRMVNDDHCFSLTRGLSHTVLLGFNISQCISSSSMSLIIPCLHAYLRKNMSADLP